MKGIVLAGGSGTRLYPITKGISKQLIPIYDKPMIYYPLSLLMLSGIRDILIISTPDDIENFKRLLGNGDEFGITLEYAIQEKPNGLAQAFVIGKDFIGDSPVCLVLGDNILHGHGLVDLLIKSRKDCVENEKATVFGFPVKNPQDFGVATLDEFGNILSIEEKPANPKSNLAVIGLYFYPNSVVNIASEEIVPSERGEYEISAINQNYLSQRNLKIIELGRGFSWFDTGTIDSLLNACNHMSNIQNNSNLLIGCLEEIGLKNKWIDKIRFKKSLDKYSKSLYGKYLSEIMDKIE